MVFVDASYVKHYVVHSKAYKELIIEEPVYFVHAFLKKVEEIRDTFGVGNGNRLVFCTDIRIQIDGRRNYWRDVLRMKNTDILHRYKDNDGVWRPKYYKEGREQDDVIPWDTINSLYKQMMIMFEKYSDFFVVGVPSMEGDDVISILSQTCNKKPIVITPDKDLINQINADVRKLNDLEKTITPPEMLYGLDEFFLKGDSGDAVPPVSYNKKWKQALKKYDGDLEKIFIELEDDRKKLWAEHKIGEYEDIFKLKDDKLIHKLQSKSFAKERLEYNRKMMCLDIKNYNPRLVDMVFNKFKEQKKSFEWLKVQEWLTKIGIQTCTDGTIKGFLEKPNFFRYQMQPQKKQKRTTKKPSQEMIDEFVTNF